MGYGESFTSVKRKSRSVTIADNSGIYKYRETLLWTLEGYLEGEATK